MKTVAIYKILKEGYLIHPNRMTASGFHVATAPYFRIQEVDSRIEIIVTAIRSAFAIDFSTRVPDPKSWAEFSGDFMQEAGLKKKTDLEKPTTRYISMSLIGDKITFTPSKHAERPDRGFLHLSTLIELPSDASDMEIGDAFLRTLDHCE